MIMQYVRIRPAEYERLVELVADDPDEAYDFVDELADASPEGTPPARSRSIDTDKAWAGISHLLTQAGDGRIIDPIHGGEILTPQEWGYGPPRRMSPDDVARAAARLEATPFELLALLFEPTEMAEIYPQIWDQDDALDYLGHWYEQLTEFFGHAAADRDGMIIYLS